MTVEPFDPTIDEEVIDDLRDRLRRTRWPDQIHTGGWDYGMNTEVLHSFVTTWLEDFDWSAQQNRLRRLRHVKVDVPGLGVTRSTKKLDRVTCCRCSSCTVGPARSSRCCRSFPF